MYTSDAATCLLLLLSNESTGTQRPGSRAKTLSARNSCNRSHHCTSPKRGSRPWSPWRPGGRSSQRFGWLDSDGFERGEERREGGKRETER